MKKVLGLAIIILMSGCAEKQEYEQAVLEQMKFEKDVKDYHIEPEKITECIVKQTSAKMPGIVVIDPERLKAYKNYTKMLKMNASPDPRKLLEELRVDFGSPKNLAEAHSIYMESMLDCMSGIVSSSEQSTKSKEAENNNKIR